MSRAQENIYDEILGHSSTNIHRCTFIYTSTPSPHYNLHDMSPLRGKTVLIEDIFKADVLLHVFARPNLGVSWVAACQRAPGGSG